MKVLAIVVTAVYGYSVVLSLWGAHLMSRRLRDEPFSDRREARIVERREHFAVAAILVVSLAIRLLQITLHLSHWLIDPLTVLAAIGTGAVLFEMVEMAGADLDRGLGLLDWVKTRLLMLCIFGLFIDQVWRFVAILV
jgi:hypothetical protein